MTAAIKKTILVVDDDDDLREVMALDLEDIGYNVLTASNGREAYDIAINNKVDMVVSDVRMPDGDGIELLDRVKEYSVAVPVVIMVTGYSDLSLEEAYHKGANALFMKPFDRKLLHSVIRLSLGDSKDRWRPENFDMNVDFKIEIKFSSKDEVTQGKVLNLGRGGMFISVEQELPDLNEKIWFKFNFVQTGLPPLEGQGVAKWLRPIAKDTLPRGFGLEFTVLNDAMRGILNDFMSGQKVRPYIPAK